MIELPRILIGENGARGESPDSTAVILSEAQRNEESSDYLKGILRPDKSGLRMTPPDVKNPPKQNGAFPEGAFGKPKLGVKNLKLYFVPIVYDG